MLVEAQDAVFQRRAVVFIGFAATKIEQLVANKASIVVPEEVADLVVVTVSEAGLSEAVFFGITEVAVVFFVVIVLIVDIRLVRRLVRTLSTVGARELLVSVATLGLIWDAWAVGLVRLLTAARFRRTVRRIGSFGSVRLFRAARCIGRVRFFGA